MRRVSLAFLIAGGLAAIAGTLVPDPDPSDHEELLALAIACLGRRRRARASGARPPEAVLAALPAVGLVLVGAAVAVADAARRDAHLLPAPAARVRLLRHARGGSSPTSALFAVGLAVVLALWVEPEARVAIFLGTAIPVVFVAVMMASLRSGAASTRTSTACASSRRPTRSPARSTTARSAALDGLAQCARPASR